MQPIPVPVALSPNPLHDELDDRVQDNRSLLITQAGAINLLASEGTALEARVAALESGGASVPVVIIDIPDRVENQLVAVGVGGVVILRGPEFDVTLVRQ